MPNDYETRVECSDTCSNMVDADVPGSLDVDSETCKEITRVVRERGGRVALSVAEVEKNSHFFTANEIGEARNDGGYSLPISVPECNSCGSDQ